MSRAIDEFVPGQRVVVTQQILRGGGAGTWTTQVRGRVLRFEQRKTGSWFAHAKDDRLWLDRLILEKEDGEIVVCHLGPYSRVEILEDAAPPAASQASPPAAAP